jgi:transcriptional regulator with XRE-family HTH domain
MTSADQALEVLAALSLNKTLLADVLGVSRPTLYDWLEGKEPNAANAQRLRSLVQLLANAGVTAADALSPRFVREALNDGEPSLLELLKADTLDEARVAKVLAEAKVLEDETEGARLAREGRLRALGFEEPTAEQRKANLALNVALREWPKD